MDKLKIVFIAFNENSLGRRIINGLVNSENVPIHTLMASPEALKKFRKNGIKRYFNQNGLFNTFWRIFYRLTVRRDIRSLSVKLDINLKSSIKEVCDNNSIPTSYFTNINDSFFIEQIKQLAPDLIILGGAPLIKKNLIEIPRIGVLNSHPGVLPNAKGIDVVSQSILAGIPLGATVFKVDEGIDSGPILLIKLLDVKYCGLKLYEIETLIEELSANAMLEAVEIISKGEYNFMPQIEKGNLFKALNFKTYNKVKKELLSK
jgi:folate-dependent phosphoribosylglycinamide formyltransferase PurN